MILKAIGKFVEVDELSVTPGPSPFRVQVLRPDPFRLDCTLPLFFGLVDRTLTVEPKAEEDMKSVSPSLSPCHSDRHHHRHTGMTPPPRMEPTIMWA